jgi:hypothetical protein
MMPIKDLSTILAVYELEPFWQFMAPEIAKSRQFMAQETASFCRFLVPDSGARNL